LLAKLKKQGYRSRRAVFQARLPGAASEHPRALNRFTGEARITDESWRAQQAKGESDRIAGEVAELFPSGKSGILPG
jgi:hypothetical protein